MYTVAETIANIREEIAEKEKEIELLENIDKLDLTWENYNKLCHTHVSDEILSAKLIERFPFLKSCRYNGGSLDFKINSSTELINDTLVRIPKYDFPEVAIFVPKPRDYRKRLYRDIDRCEKEIEHYKSLANADFKTKVEYQTKGIQKGFCTIAYFLNGGNKHHQAEMIRNIRRLEDAVERKRAEIKDISDGLYKYGMIVQHLYHYAFPLFYEWCDRICVENPIHLGARTNFNKKNYKYR